MKRITGILLALVIGFTSVYVVGPESVQAAAVKPIVVVLDAGHGGRASGAYNVWSRKRYTEKDLNLTIAKYAKKELEQYVGVKVYMTRTDDRYVSLEDRVLFAEEKNADLFVSLHNNSNASSSMRGACVYYPNYNYSKPIAEEGRQVALCIQAQLASLGLKNRGVRYRNSENQTRYPDRKLADYYSVIRNSKLCGFPGLIVEHAYMSNSLDCSQFLSSDSKLKKLGVADATGIAKAYGLVKGKAPVLTKAKNRPDGSVKLVWTASEGMGGYSIYRKQVGKKKFQLIADVKGGKKTSYVDNSAVGGVSYEYYVTAWVTKKKVTRGTGASNHLSVLALGAPEYVKLYREEGNVLLSFAPVEGANGYLVARRASAEESYTVVAELDADTLFWLDSDLGEGQEYDYQVCAFVINQTIQMTGAYTSAVVDTIETESETEE